MIHCVTTVFFIDIQTCSYHVRIFDTTLPGVQRDNDVIFNLTHLWQPNHAFPVGVSWSVHGRLSVVGPRLTYEGKVVSSQSGFTKLVMSPTPAAG